MRDQGLLCGKGAPFIVSGALAIGCASRKGALDSQASPWSPRQNNWDEWAQTPAAFFNM